MRGSATADRWPRLGGRLSRWTPRSLGRMGQVRAGCQGGEAGGCGCLGGGGGDGAGEAGKAGNQACHGDHSTRNAAAAAHPSHRPGPSCGPLRGLGFPSPEPCRGPWSQGPARQWWLWGRLCPLLCGLGEQEACSDSVPRTHPQVPRQQGPRRPSRVATRSQPASGPCTTW